jgi:hypothetical protein
MNWKAEVNRMNVSAYAWPKGWSTRDEIAEQVECSPERVREVLNPGIKAGTIEFRDFKVWEDGRFVRRTGYRKVSQAAASAPKVAPQAMEPKAGMPVVSRKRGTKGKIVSVKGDRMVIEWETTGRKECSMSAFRKKDIRLA